MRKELKFRFNEQHDEWRGRRLHGVDDAFINKAPMWLCRSVERAYNIPKTAKTIWIVVSDKRCPARDATQYEFTVKPDGSVVIKHRLPPYLPVQFNHWMTAQYEAGARWVWVEYSKEKV